MRKSISSVGGSLTALATPFRDMDVDWDALSRLSERQIDRGTAALIVCGSTGEAAALTSPNTPAPYTRWSRPSTAACR
jgi:dihydrodipicolinate synthase/N-acetylneuraminate lyase